MSKNVVFSTKGVDFEEMKTVLKSVVKSTGKWEFAEVTETESSLKIIINEAANNNFKFVTGIYVDIDIVLTKEDDVATLIITTPIWYWMAQGVRGLITGGFGPVLLVPVYGAYGQFKFESSVFNNYKDTVMQLSMSSQS